MIAAADQRADVAVQHARARPYQGEEAVLDVEAVRPEAAAFNVGVDERHERQSGRHRVNGTHIRFLPVRGPCWLPVPGGVFGPAPRLVVSCAVLHGWRRRVGR